MIIVDLIRLVTELILLRRQFTAKGPQEDHDEPEKKKVKQMGPDSDQQKQDADVSSTDSVVVVYEKVVSSPTTVLQRLPAVNDSPPRDNQQLPNEGWKTAPARLESQATREAYAKASPIHFLKTENWPPARRRRLRDSFFERKSDGDWNFASIVAN